MMASPDEESGSKGDENTEISNKNYVKGVYNTIAIVIGSTLATALVGFLLFCIGWVFWNADLLPVVPLSLIIFCEIGVWILSLSTEDINKQENWDALTTRRMLGFGMMYLLLVLLEVAMTVALFYLMSFDDVSPEWTLAFTYMTLIFGFAILGTFHIVSHFPNMYCQGPLE